MTGHNDYGPVYERQAIIKKNRRIFAGFARQL